MPLAGYTWLAQTEAAPLASTTDAGELLPSPQAKVAVWLAWSPASMKGPTKDSNWPRTRGLGLGPLRGPTAGARLLTVRLMSPVPEAPWLSVTLTLTG